MDDDIVGFTEDTARRIILATRYIEDQPRNAIARRAPQIQTTFIKMFLVTVQVEGALDADTPGYGYGVMMWFNVDEGRFVETDQPEFLIWNMSFSNIIVNARVQCVSLDGQWFYTMCDCVYGTPGSGSAGDSGSP